MKILLFILLLAAVTRIYRRLFLPRPLPGQEPPRLGWTNAFLVLVISIVSLNVLASAGHVLAHTFLDRCALPRPEVAAEPETSGGPEIDLLVESYRNEERALESKLARARASGASYEAAKRDPELSRTLDRLVVIRERLAELEAERR